MNLLARFRTFFRRSFALRCVLGVILAGALSLGATSVYAQAGGGTNAPAGFDTAWTQGTTGLDGCSGITGCLFQVLGVMVTYIFSIITLFLSKVLVILTGVLIVFARYNAFNTAPVVTMGWVIIRDLVNVFFIVILMASAFMSIIGLGDKYGLHYKKVLPGLVVGAIVVNFSRTLMLLAIDASQVVTMTFISAFEGTIAGNIFQAFGISRMTQLQTQAAQAGPQATQQALDVASIGVAYLLAIFMLVTAVAIVLLYVGYFIFRIIGLWLLIVVSPAAFVASSLPGQFKSALGTLTDGFWKKFGTFITGGPTIAFMLWLAFAVIQETSAQMAGSGGCTPGAGAQNLMGFEIPASLQTGVFVNCMGTVPQLATFIVSASLLAIGFGAATSTVQQTGAIGGALVGIVDKQRKAWMGRLQRAPITVGKAAGRGVAAAGRGVFNAADRKWGLSNQFGRGVAGGINGARGAGALTRAGGVVGSAMRIIPGVGAVAATGLAGAAMSRRKGLLETDAKAMGERMGKLDALPPGERLDALRNLSGGPLGGLGESSALLALQHEQMSKPEMRKEALKGFRSSHEERLLADAQSALPAGEVLSDRRKNEIKKQASALADQDLRNEEQARIRELQRIAEQANDTVQTDALKKEIERTMGYADDPAGDAKYKEQVNKLLAETDPSKEIGGLDESVQKSGRFAMALLQAKGVTDATGTSKPDQLLLDRVREEFKGNKELVATIDAVAKQIEGGGSTLAQINGTMRQTDSFGNQRLYNRTGDGEAMYSTKEEDAKRALGGANSGNITAAMFRAIDAELPLKEIQEILEKQNTTFAGAGNAAKQVSLYLSRITDGVRDEKSRLAALKQINTVLDMAKEASFTSKETEAIIQGVMDTDEKLERLLGNFGSMSQEGKKNGTQLLRVAVQLESNPIIADGLRYVRETIAPEQKTTVTFTNPVTGASETQERGGYKGVSQIIHTSTT